MKPSAFHDEGGYISDVPSVASNNGSDVSQDLVAQTKVLEKHFRDKYQVLRSAYEQRVKELGHVVQTTCASLVSDEIIQEMRTDRASSMFIPAHVHEVIEKHLHADRERFVHEILQKNSVLESELNQCKLGSSKLKAELRELQKAAAAADAQSKQQMHALTKSLQEKVKECDKLHKLAEQKAYEVDVLEQSFQQSARELAIIENIDQQSQKHRQDFQEQFTQMTKQRNQMVQENMEMKAQFTLMTEEAARNAEVLAQYHKDEEGNKRRMQEMMREVGMILDQEANESNQAISTVNEKMKAFRNRLVSELNKERRITASLQDELNKIKSTRDTHYDQKKHLEEQAAWRDRLHAEQQKNTQMSSLVTNQTNALNDNKITINNLENRIKLLIDKLEDQELQNKKERQLLVEKVRMETQRDVEVNMRRQENKDNSHLHHLENEMAHLTNTILRQSLNSNSGADSQQQLQQSERNYQKIILTLQAEKEDLLHKLRAGESEVDHARRQMSDLTNVITSLTAQGQEMSADQNKFKEVLKTATGNIDKLRAMVQEGKNVIIKQKEQIAALQDELAAVQAELQNEQHQRKDAQTAVKAAQDETKHAHDEALQAKEAARAATEERRLAQQAADIANAAAAKGIILKDGELVIQRSQWNEQSQQLFDAQHALSEWQDKVSELQTANATLTTVIANMASAAANAATTASAAVAANAVRDDMEDGWRSMVSNNSDSAPHSHQQFRGYQQSAGQSDGYSEGSVTSTAASRPIDCRDASVNTTENLQLLEVSGRLERCQMDNQLLQSKLEHHQEQMVALKKELQDERQQLLQAKSQGHRLYQLVNTVHTIYMPQLNALKQCLVDIRSQYHNYQLFIQNESMHTLQKFRGEFTRIFDGFTSKQRQRLQSLKVQLSTAHSQELTALEQRFIAQVNTLNQKQSQDMDKMHRDLLGRAEKVMGLSSLSDDSNLLGESTSTFNSTMLHSSTVTANAAVPAYESVLKGVLQALLDGQVLGTDRSNQIQALAKAHREPSLAANAAARALVSEEVDGFAARR